MTLLEAYIANLRVYAEMSADEQDSSVGTALEAVMTRQWAEMTEDEKQAVGRYEIVPLSQGAST